MGDVVAIRSEPENLRCECGDEWWQTSVVIQAGGEGHVTGYLFPLTCVSCGAKRNDVD